MIINGKGDTDIAVLQRPHQSRQSSRSCIHAISCMAETLLSVGHYTSAACVSPRRMLSGCHDECGSPLLAVRHRRS
jgi:hypothetical protein